MLDIAYAPPENWVEVVRFTGVGGDTYTTDYFVCEHAIWRIRLEITPNIYIIGDMGYFLNVTTYPEGEFSDYIDRIDDSRFERTSEPLDGIHNIRDKPGRFYMKISAGYRTVNYAVIVEQYITSASEDPSAYTSVTNWSEVARFSGLGSENYTSDYFSCDYEEWRIRWEYVPSSQQPDLAFFSVFTYPKNDDIRGATYVNEIMKTGTADTNGTSFIHNYQGTFHMYIDVEETESYTIIVEQNLNSIPEFPSWIILPLILTIIVFSVLVKRKL